LRVQHDGHFWIAKKRYEWWDEVRLSPKEIDRAIAQLVRKGLIEVRIYKFDNDPTTHIRLIKEKFLKEFEQQLYSKKENPFLPKGEKPKLEEEQWSGLPLFPKGEKGNSPKGEKEITQKGISNLPKGEILLTETTPTDHKQKITAGEENLVAAGAASELSASPSSDLDLNRYPETLEEQALFNMLEIEKPEIAREFPSISCKEKFRIHLERLGRHYLQEAVCAATAKGILTVYGVVSYIAKFKHRITVDEVIDYWDYREKHPQYSYSSVIPRPVIEEVNRLEAMYSTDALEGVILWAHDNNVQYLDQCISELEDCTIEIAQ
jgi:hypothetical protein